MGLAEQITQQIRNKLDNYAGQINISDYERMASVIKNVLSNSINLIEDIEIKDDTIILNEKRYWDLVPYLDFVLPIERYKEYKLMFCGKNMGIIIYQDPTIDNEHIVRHFSVQPAVPVKYINITFSVKGGDKDDGEIRR